MLEWGENRRCLRLSACLLAVSLSWVCFHTSSERGHSELPTDMKIRAIVQLIGILWSYFGVQLESGRYPLHFGLILCNPLKQIEFHTSSSERREVFYNVECMNEAQSQLFPCRHCWSCPWGPTSPSINMQQTNATTSCPLTHEELKSGLKLGMQN